MPSAWVQHVQTVYRKGKAKGMTYRAAMVAAKKTWKSKKSAAAPAKKAKGGRKKKSKDEDEKEEEEEDEAPRPKRRGKIKAF